MEADVDDKINEISAFNLNMIVDDENTNIIKNGKIDEQTFKKSKRVLFAFSFEKFIFPTAGNYKFSLDFVDQYGKLIDSIQASYSIEISESIPKKNSAIQNTKKIT